VIERHEAQRRTPLTDAVVAELQRNALPIAGLIYHLSRSGSTLTAAACGAWPGTRVVDESVALNEALAAERAEPDPNHLLLRAVLAALAGPGAGAERVVIKLDPWHILALPELQSVLAGVPWLFVYRDPLEVLVSHARQPGSHVVPGALSEVWFGSGPGGNGLEYGARILGLLCSAVLPQATSEALLNYDELPGALMTRVPQRFGFDPQAVDQETLATVFAYDAKRPHERFSSDSARKRAAATPEIAEVAERWIGAQYRSLEGIRRVAHNDPDRDPKSPEGTQSNVQMA
jgi:hypothetical protein